MRSLLRRLDGIVFPGGPDVDSAVYGARPHPRTCSDPDLDRHELPIVRWAVARSIPVLGICRGQQLINVALGGTLLQDVPQHRRRFWRTVYTHALHVQPASRFAEILGATNLHVNSLHHQAVANLGLGLRAVAWAPDGTIEALESAHHPWLFTVQFHPEELVPGHKPSQRLFSAFVAACRTSTRPVYQFSTTATSRLNPHYPAGWGISAHARA